MISALFRWLFILRFTLNSDFFILIISLEDMIRLVCCYRKYFTSSGILYLYKRQVWETMAYRWHIWDVVHYPYFKTLIDFKIIYPVLCVKCYFLSLTYFKQTNVTSLLCYYHYFYGIYLDELYSSISIAQTILTKTCHNTIIDLKNTDFLCIWNITRKV